MCRFFLCSTPTSAACSRSKYRRETSPLGTIFTAGDPGTYAYLVQQGKVNVSITDLADERIIVDVCESGGLLGMSSLLAQAEHLTTAVAIEDTSAIEIDRNDITTLLQQKPLAGLDMMTMIETQLRSTHELMRTRVTRNLNTAMEEAETLGDRLADVVAKFGGSWKFVHQLRRCLDRLHADQHLCRQALGSLSIHLAQFIFVDACRRPGTGHHDESESTGRQRPHAQRAGLQRQSKSRAGDR
jgi:CRP-like cAMP-binding protein